MSNKQIWATIVLTFVLLLTFIVGGLCYGVLSSPAATSEINIEGSVSLSRLDNGDYVLDNIHVGKIYGKVNSKILDLILSAVNN